MFCRPKPGSGASRPDCAPAYHLGRPASLQISVMRPRRGRNAPNHLAGAITGGLERALSQSGRPFAGSGSETVCVPPIKI